VGECDVNVHGRHDGTDDAVDRSGADVRKHFPPSVTLDSIIKQVAPNKSSLLLMIILRNTQTLQPN
jgi:hypothetical protein